MSTDTAYFGIDFGTTNSSMAWCDPNSGEAKIIRNAEGEEKTPSLVYFGEEEEVLVGRPVEDLLEEVGDSDDPQERAEVTGRLVRSIKRNLINPPVIPISGGEPVRPVEVVAQILGKLKHDAQEEHFHEEVGRVVITCPAVFDEREREVLLEAAAMAGFVRVEVLEEPMAAALAISRLGQKVGKGVLVYDLGAGTFDLSVVARDEEEGSFYPLVEPQGDPRCGGDDLDLALYHHCDEVALETLGRAISPTREVDQVFLRQCRERKENLSKREKSRFSSLLSSEGRTPQRFKHEVERETFEGLIRGRIEGTAAKTARLLAQVDDEVQTVILIGGSSRVPLVERLLSESLSIKPRNFAEKDYAVALGAAYHAYELWKQAEKISDTPEPWYEKGLALYKQGRYEEAMEAFDRAIRIKPDYSRAWCYKGVALYNQGRHEEAIEAYDRAIKIKPDDAAVWYNKGQALRVLGRNQEALEAYDQAIKINPDDSDAWHNKGVALGNLGRSEEALEAYDQATRIKSDDHYVWNEKGKALYNQGRHEEAIEAYDRAIKIKPDDAAVWYNKGQALRVLGRNQEALEAYDQAIKINPDDSDAWHNKGVALGNLGRSEEALEAYDRALRIDPNDAEAWYNKGVLLKALGRSEEAIEACDQAIKIKPDYSRAWYNKGVLLKALGRSEEALEAYDRAISIDPNDADHWCNKGVALYHLGYTLEAMEAYDQAIRINPDHAVAWCNKGVALHKLRRKREAVAAYDQAIRIDPNHALARQNKSLASRRWWQY